MIRAKLDRVGIVMMSAVGDAVHVLPLLTALKAHRPDAHVTWVLQPGAATLVRGHRAVDEIIEFDRARGWRAYPAVRRALAHRPFDVVLALQVYFKAGIVTSFAHAPVKLGFDRAVPAHERRRARLQHPRHARVGAVRLERREEGQHVHRVAHGTHHDDPDPRRASGQRHHDSALRHAGLR